MHGFELARQLAESSRAKSLTAHGTLYKALGRLAGVGLLESQWEDPDVALAGRAPAPAPLPPDRRGRATPRGRASGGLQACGDAEAADRLMVALAHRARVGPHLHPRHARARAPSPPRRARERPLGAPRPRGLDRPPAQRGSAGDRRTDGARRGGGRRLAVRASLGPALARDHAPGRLDGVRAGNRVHPHPDRDVRSAGARHLQGRELGAGRGARERPRHGSGVRCARRRPGAAAPPRERRDGARRRSRAPASRSTRSGCGRSWFPARRPASPARSRSRTTAAPAHSAPPSAER